MVSESGNNMNNLSVIKNPNKNNENNIILKKQIKKRESKETTTNKNYEPSSEQNKVKTTF